MAVGSSASKSADSLAKVLAFYKKFPEKEVNPAIDNLIVWESSHKITGRGIFLFADSKIIFLSSLDEKSVALWSNDLSLAEIVRNIASIEKLGKLKRNLSERCMKGKIEIMNSK